ncbi:MAG: SufE family protein [Xanthomonadales bacterium]|jgi:cysteine desulfuration protein SufE|nr:SufE family protein [Xanthomonadales bacterium]
MNDPRQTQQGIIDDFSLFPEWLDRYQYLIDLGKKLEPLEDTERVDENLLDGCQSRVWLVIDGDESQMRIRANSDAAIVSGLIALLIRLYDRASPSDVLATEPEFIEAIGLSQHLSPTRANGLGAMLNAIRARAAALAA